MYQLKSGILIHILWCKWNVAGRKQNIKEYTNLTIYIDTYFTKQRFIYFIIILSPWVYFAFLMFPI